jgi:hypothetical protein
MARDGVSGPNGEQARPFRSRPERSQAQAASVLLAWVMGNMAYGHLGKLQS